jgi:carboxypeptidase C (cathepsin A)
MRLVRLLLAFLALAALAPTVAAQDHPGQPDRTAQIKPDAPHEPGVLRLLPSDSASDKEITIGGRKIAYTATAGTLPLFDQNGDKTAARAGSTPAATCGSSGR